MLALSRRTNEGIVITAKDGSRLRLSIKSVEGDKVRIAFEDDARLFTIHRDEVQAQVDEANEGVVKQ